MTTLLLLLATIGQCQGGDCPRPASWGRVPVAPYYPPGPIPVPIPVPPRPQPQDATLPQPMKAKDFSGVNEARKKLQAGGYKVSDLAPPRPDWIASYQPKERAIRLDMWSSYWEDRARNAKINYGTGFNSTPHPDHILRHEMGHAELHKAIGDAAYEALQESPLPLPAERIRSTVSAYAANSTIDFHAEVYAGLKDGRVFPADVMKAYANLMRPK